MYSVQLQRRRSGAPDILCLQEVFRRSDAKEIVEAVRNDYPFYASFEDLEEGAGMQRACTPQEAGTAAACLLQFCANLTSAQTVSELVQLFNCSLQNCLRFSQLSQSCQSCLIFETQDLPDGVDLFTHCATNVPANDYTAPYGLLLLSRHNLSNITASGFLDPPFVTYLPRGYIAAEVCESLLDFPFYTQCCSNPGDGITVLFLVLVTVHEFMNLTHARGWFTSKYAQKSQ